MRVNEASMILGSSLRSVLAADESLHAVADDRELRVLVGDDLGALASATLRKARVSVPERWASAIVFTSVGPSSSVAVSPTATRSPFFSSILGPMARTRMFCSKVSLA